MTIENIHSIYPQALYFQTRQTVVFLYENFYKNVGNFLELINLEF